MVNDGFPYVAREHHPFTVTAKIIRKMKICSDMQSLPLVVRGKKRHPKQFVWTRPHGTIAYRIKIFVHNVKDL